MEHYNSDCEPDYLRHRDRHVLENTSPGDVPPPSVTVPVPAPAPEVTYAQPHQQRSSMGSPMKLVSTVSAGKYQTNANLGLFPNSSSSGSSVQNGAGAAVASPRSTNPFLNSKFSGEENALDNVLLPASASSSTAASSNRSHRSGGGGGAARSTLNRLSGMTNSSSDSHHHQQQQQQLSSQLAAVKQLLQPEDSGDEFVLGRGGNCSNSSGRESEEPPPEPAPPEIPPRTQSLLMSLRKHSDYKLKYEEKGDQKHEEFIPTSQLQKGECF